MASIGARAQFGRFGSPTSFLDMALNRASSYGSALEGMTAKQYSLQKYAQEKQAEMFNKRQELSRLMGEGQYNLGDEIFDQSMAFQNKQFEDSQLNPLERFVATTLPLASTGLLAFAQKKQSAKANEQYKQIMQDYLNQLRSIYQSAPDINNLAQQFYNQYAGQFGFGNNLLGQYNNLYGGLKNYYSKKY